jgi:hypothetical protein
LKPEGARSRFHIAQHSCRGETCRIEEPSHTCGRGHQPAQEFQPLCY